MKSSLSRVRAMRMKCHQCMGGYVDGRVDCCVTTCAIYPWMKYRKLEPDLSWVKLNPSRVGDVAVEKSKRVFTEADKAAARARLQKARKTKVRDETDPTG